MDERDPHFEAALLRADLHAGNKEAAIMQANVADPYGVYGSRHRFWWADATYLTPGLHYRHRRVLPVSMWILRPRYSWRVRGIK